MMRLLYLLPKHTLSRVVGRLAHLQIPFLSQTFIKIFVRFYRVNVQESAQPMNSYGSLGEFFVRDLAPGLRPLGDGVVSPVDGVITEFGTVNSGRLLQVKGLTYNVTNLLGDHSLAERFRNGYFFTLYLAPHNYHQIHSPVSGSVLESIYIPGELWPVNSWSVRHVPGLFARNERVITVIESDGALFAVVKVGATNVGSISLAYDGLRTNLSAKDRAESFPQRRRSYTGLELAKGAKLGAFHLGSTVVLLIEQGRFSLREGLVGGEVRLGQTLGNIV